MRTFAIFLGTVFAIARFTVAGDCLIAIAFGAFAIFLSTIFAVARFAVAGYSFIAIALRALAVFLGTVFAIAGRTVAENFGNTCSDSCLSRLSTASKRKTGHT